MASVISSRSSGDSPSVIRAPANPTHTQSDPTTLDPEKHTDSGFKSFHRFRHRKTKSIPIALQLWEHQNRPYHDYVHQLVAAGYSNLQELDTYLSADSVYDDGLVVSVVDILQSPTSALEVARDFHNELELKDFIDGNKKADGNVRLYLAEYARTPSAELIETFGAGLNLDPRFFQWTQKNNGHIFTPSQRHRAPYLSLGFGVLEDLTTKTTDAKRFKVLIYIQPDESNNGWTGIIFFNSHAKIKLSPIILTNPPAFKSALPPSSPTSYRSFREIYLESLSFLDLAKTPLSPFYTISMIFHLNCYCWNQIISAMRAEDRRVNGISDTSIGHAEEIKKSLDIVRRHGSLGWKGSAESVAKEQRTALEEDFVHLVQQTDLLWQTRDKMATVRERNSEGRWTALTNAFTYLFAPVTIISGIYGMNVSEISGSSTNPNIWQFFVAVAIFNVLVLLALSVSNWFSIHWKHGRTAGVKEVVAMAFGKVSSK